MFHDGYQIQRYKQSEFYTGVEKLTNTCLLFSATTAQLAQVYKPVIFGSLSIASFALFYMFNTSRVKQSKEILLSDQTIDSIIESNKKNG